jgi:Domain of unknown function (DUF4129)
MNRSTLTRLLRSSPERRLVPAALLLAGLVLAGLVLGEDMPAAAQPVAPDAARAKALAALADPRFQRALPAHRELAGAPASGKREAAPNEAPISEADDDAASRSLALPALGFGALLGKVVFTVLLVVAGVLIVAWIAREGMARKRGNTLLTPVPAAADAAAGPERIAATFDDASRLAAEGHYAEAVHALLLAAIRHFAARAKTPVQASRTSRELVRVLPLSPDAREAFAELVRTVELSLFGGGEVGAEDYERNRARFQTLTGRAA